MIMLVFVLDLSSTYERKHVNFVFLNLANFRGKDLEYVFCVRKAGTEITIMPPVISVNFQNLHSLCASIFLCIHACIHMKSTILSLILRFDVMNECIDILKVDTSMLGMESYFKY
jgi:hypothetical protein